MKRESMCVCVCLSVTLTWGFALTCEAPIRTTVLSLKPVDRIETKTTNFRMSVRATHYHAVRGQCDGDPTETADGSRIRSIRHAELHRWIAVSHDLRRRYPFGTVVYVSGLGGLSGEFTVHDLMNRRYRRRIDVLVGTKSGITNEHWRCVTVELVRLPTKVRR